MSVIDSIQISGVTYTIQGSGGGGNPTVELTQAEYDALVTAGTVSPNTYYIITDASGGDLSNYMSSAQTMSAITEATSGKADTTAVTQSITEATSGKVDSNVYTAYTASTDTAIQGKQDTLVSGTNIKTINNESLLGSGNITIQGGGGGGKAISAGRGISITTGETADTVSLDVPIYKTENGTGNTCVGTTNDVGLGSYNCFLVGENNNTTFYQSDSILCGNNNYINEIRCSSSQCFGSYNKINNAREFASGCYNNSIQSNSTFGDSGNTLFSVGNGTADNARHNAFEIRQNGDIYITSGGTDIKLQDNLGGGGGEGTVSALTETNPVALNGDYSTYYTATTIDTIYLISKFDNTFYNCYTMGGYLSDDGYFDIYTSGNENGITSVSTSTAFTSTITDGIAEIKFVSPLTPKRILDLRNSFIAYYFPPTPYTSGSTSEVVEGAVYDSLRKLSLDVLQKDGIHDYYIYTTDNGFGFNLSTDKNNYSGILALASPTINFNGGKLNTQFSSTTASQVVINNGNSEYCTLFHSKPYDDITITFNPSYNGGVTQANFTIYAQISEYQSVQKYFTYDIANNSISWSSISQFNSGECLICGVDHPNPNGFVVTLVTTTSNIHDGQEIIDDLYANKQDKLSAGTNITIVDNVISAEGGGGKAVSGGTNISVTTGETADTINCTLPITATTDTTNKTISIGQGITADTSSNGCVVIGSAAKGKTYDVVVGNKAKNNGNWNENVIIGYEAKGYSQSIAIGSYTETYNDYQGGGVAIGYYARAKNIKNAVAIGAEVSTTGTTKTNINNQLRIDTSNQVYISNSANTSTYCLQEKIENTEAALGGLSLVKLTQAQYDALATKDSNTLYVIVN